VISLATTSALTGLGTAAAANIETTRSNIKAIVCFLFVFIFFSPILVLCTHQKLFNKHYLTLKFPFCTRHELKAGATLQKRRKKHKIVAPSQFPIQLKSQQKILHEKYANQFQ